jgi:hypothetical protein
MIVAEVRANTACRDALTVKVVRVDGRWDAFPGPIRRPTPTVYPSLSGSHRSFVPNTISPNKTEYTSLAGVEPSERKSPY